MQLNLHSTKLLLNIKLEKNYARFIKKKKKEKELPNKC